MKTTTAIVQRSLRVYAGPKPVLSEGNVLPMNESAYPELVNHPLKCLGECGEVKPATIFPYHATQGTGLGRAVECRKCRDERRGKNAMRRAKGQEPLPRPRETVWAEQ